MTTGPDVEDLTVSGKVFIYPFGPAIEKRKGRPYEAGEKVWNPGCSSGSSVQPSLRQITEGWTGHSD